MSRQTAIGRTLLALVFGMLLAGILAEGVARSYFLLASGGATSSGLTHQEGKLFEHDELVGHRMIPGARIRFAGPEFDVQFEINKAGFRQDADVSPDRRPRSRRILLVGDSFTFGQGVATGERFGEKLSAALPNVEVVNMGLSGTGTDQQFLLYRRDGVKYEPDLVLLCYMTENIRRNATAARLQPDGRMVPKPKFELRDGELVLTNVPVPRESRESGDNERAWQRRYSTGLPIPFKQQLDQYSAAYRLVRSRLGGIARAASGKRLEPFAEYDDARPEWQLTAAIIREFAKTAAANRSTFVLVIVPPQECVYEPQVGDRPHEMLRSFAKSEGIAVIDLLPAFRKAAGQPQQLYFPMDTHWTPTGHSVAAQAIAERLTDLAAAR